MNTIEIITNNWFGNVGKATIPAVIIGGFAIHRKFQHVKSADNNEWAITHIKSGLACCHRKNLILAKQTAKDFDKLSVGGVAFRDMAACEALALVPVMLSQWSKITNEELTDERFGDLIEQAARTADILACAR